MNLKILLPHEVFVEEQNVKSIQIETSEGSFGILPRRLDCVAALKAGIFSYSTDTIHYVALDQGLLVKESVNVSISARNAIGGSNLGELRESVEREFLNLDEDEKHTRLQVMKLESSFMQAFERYRKE